MSKQQEITDWLAGCPQLAELWNISAEAVDGANVLLPSGTSARRSVADMLDITGAYSIDILPEPSVYEEYQINCYKAFASNDNAFNVLKIDEVEAVIDWIISQDEAGIFPEITGKTVVAVEPFPFIPQIRGVDPDTGLICYYITLRVTYINTAQRRSALWQM